MDGYGIYRLPALLTNCYARHFVVKVGIPPTVHIALHTTNVLKQFLNDLFKKDLNDVEENLLVNVHALSCELSS